MSDRSTQKKQDYLDWMYEKFCASSKAYVSEVKAVLGSQSKVNAVEIFEKAIDVLSQDFPDPTSIDEQTKDEVNNGNELNSLKDQIAQMEKQLKEAQGKTSTLESELESVRLEAQILESHLNSTMKKNLRLDAKIDGLKDTVVTLVSETKETAAAAAATATTATATAAVTPPPTAATASAISRPPKCVRQRTNFTVKVAKDRSTPLIVDVQLLSCERILLTDWGNECVKLFDTQGQHLDILQCRKPPHYLAVIDSSGASNCITIAVTFPGDSAIDILEVVDVSIKVKKTILTSREYYSVAAVNKQTLAVAQMINFGIDLIDLDGQILRQICPSVRPRYMVTTEDGELICSTVGDKIARVPVDTGAVIFNHSGNYEGCPKRNRKRGITQRVLIR
ncbi:hypothetical protein PoB_007646500 [Plakobranchus ocellatus]|uniref:Uncharacterized protein n=1 Tax=Plakobranchus ocellatus TaxID=259542 RepID=A0AAV4E0P4_9GAST|nr:hypothetical protein PoB_007646500 [Plakobranchus ocellatus]